jgi:polar amino acid transport system substrate-binding protein
LTGAGRRARLWRGALGALCGLALIVVVSGCATVGSGAAPVGAWAPLATATPDPGTTATPPGCDDSKPPTDDVPPPTSRQLATDPVLARIRKYGKLRVGVSRDALGFGSWNVLNHRFEGFDVDVARQIARAVFPASAAHVDDRIEYHPLSFAERVGAIQRGSVDLVASTMTITCARRTDVSFSAPYYVAYPTFLARRQIHSLDDLRGQMICVAAGSTTAAKLARLRLTHPFIPITQVREELSDCLVDFQDLKVDVVAANDATLGGMRIEDATARLGPYEFPPVDDQGRTAAGVQPEWYGLGLNKDRADLTFRGFVNGVLERMRTDGTWLGLCREWSSYATSCVAGAPPPPSYLRRSR